MFKLMNLFLLNKEYDKGRNLSEKQKWIFAIYNTTEEICIIQCVNQQNAEILISNGGTRVAAGSIIHSDGWSAYNNSNNIQEIPYKGEKVIVIVHCYYLRETTCITIFIISLLCLYGTVSSLEDRNEGFSDVNKRDTQVLRLI